MCSCHSTHHFISFVTMADPPDAAQAASAVTAQGASDQMAADALKMMAADEQNEVSEVESGLSDSEGSGVSATTRLTRSSYPASRKVKKKASKKKDTSKRKDGVKDCWACKSSSANLDELQEYWRRKLNSEKLGKKAEELAKIRQRWGRVPKDNGDPSGEQCYYCRRTIRARARYSEMKTKELRQKLEKPKDDDDKALKDDFDADRQGVVGLLAAKGPDCHLSAQDLDAVAEVWMEEVAGEEVSADGIRMSEEVFLRRYTEADRKQLNWKKEQVKDIKTGKVKSIVRIFDEEEGVERFKMFQKRQAVKRLKIGNSDANMEDVDKFFEAVANSIGPGSCKGYLTAADVKGMAGNEPMSKAERKNSKMNPRRGNF